MSRSQPGTQHTVGPLAVLEERTGLERTQAQMQNELPDTTSSPMVYVWIFVYTVMKRNNCNIIKSTGKDCTQLIDCKKDKCPTCNLKERDGGPFFRAIWVAICWSNLPQSSRSCLLQGPVTEAMCFHTRLPKDYEKQASILYKGKI